MFTIFTISMIIGVSLPAKRYRRTVGVLSVFLVVLLAFFDPLSSGFPSHPRSPAFRWGSCAVWTGVFLLTASLVIAFYERKSASIQKSRPKEPLPVSLPYDLVLATLTHLSRVEKFMKRFHPLQRGDFRGPFPDDQGHESPHSNERRPGLLTS